MNDSKSLLVVIMKEKLAAETVKKIEQRFTHKKQPATYLFIDHAYNSAVRARLIRHTYSTGCSGKIVFFKALNAVGVYSHSYWLVIFCTTNISRVLKVVKPGL